MKKFLVVVLALALAGPLAACGRKGNPEAPENADPRYPRAYPGSAAPRPAAPAPGPGPGIDDTFIPRPTP